MRLPLDHDPEVARELAEARADAAILADKLVTLLDADGAPLDEQERRRLAIWASTLVPNTWGRT